MTRDSMTFLFISDLHYGDTRGMPLLSLREIADITNHLQPDILVNLNDTIAPPRRLATPEGVTPDSQYLALWHEYGRELRDRLTMPSIDVGTHRDLAIWPQIAKNPPFGVEHFDSASLLWLAPEEGVQKLSEEQLRWALEEIAGQAGRIWLIASHAPVEGSHADKNSEDLRGSEELKAGVQKHARLGVLVGGHLHITHSPPAQEGNCLLLIGGGMNQMQSNGHSYGKVVTLDPEHITIQTFHLNTGQIEQAWEYPIKRESNG